MRTLDNGKLTAADKKTLTQQQNQLSKQIYQDKRNSAVQNTNPKSEVGKRQGNQQDRIAQGIQSGQVTAGEAAHLEHNQAKINQEVRADRQANGGKLTAQEKAQSPAKSPVAPDLSRQAQQPASISGANTTRRRTERLSSRRGKATPPGSHRRRFLFARLLSHLPSRVTPRKYGKSSA